MWAIYFLNQSNISWLHAILTSSNRSLYIWVCILKMCCYNFRFNMTFTISVPCKILALYISSFYVWNKGLSGALGSVLGYDPEDNKWFGYASDKESTLLSKDGGDTWLSTSHDTYLTSRDKSSFQISKRVPWSTTNLDDPSAPHSSYQSSNWGGRYIHIKLSDAYFSFIC